ncbi:hypothetical protein Q765_08230 [Flavobacterium rivuli WB 3.3-2 = DSM 21788]|uniref:Histidine kinase n=1 Tax=Flavobacterium rivuli WB 3.3-2 = DSM 21788 TaxID=1121895 RepID=A0A0A2M2R4_9FLAO|nr:hypothetical protein Q765_08230 [Flavobacterium rivuli WB 3.3-2 = DSM 21788]
MTFSKFASYLGYVSSIALVIGLVIGFLFYKKLDRLHKRILIYMALMLAVDIACRILQYYKHPNMIVLPIFSFAELLFFVYIYNSYLLKKESKIIIGLGLLALVYIIAEFLQYFVFNTLNLKQFQPYCKITDNFVIIIMALAFYYQKMNSFNETKWNNFRLNTAILIYFTINTIIYIPFNFIINENIGVRFYIWMVNIVIILLFYSYLSILIWKNGRRVIAKS